MAEGELLPHHIAIDDAKKLGIHIDDAEDWVAAGHPWKPKPPPPPPPSWLDSYRNLPFPLHAYPPAVRHWIEHTAISVSVHPDMIATYLLPIFGALIGNAREYGYKDDWHERARIYAAVVADPGTKKTPALTKALAPLRQIQARHARTYADQKAAWDRLSRTEKAETPEPELAQILADDATIEAVAKIIHGHPRGVLMKRDELAGWVAGQGQYKQGRGDDRQQWLEFWSGGDKIINRVGRRSLHIADPYICLVGGIQPDKVHALIDRDDDGLVYRFLLANIPPVDEHADSPSVPANIRQSFTDVCEALYALPTYGAGTEPQPLRVKASGGGRQATVERVQNIIDEKRHPDLAPHLKGFWAKHEAHQLRITLILCELWHVAEGTDEIVTEAHADAAAEVVDYYKSQAITLFGDQARNSRPDYGRAGPRDEQRLIDWLRHRGGSGDMREARRGPLRGLSVDDARKLILGLAAEGHFDVEEGLSRRVTMHLRVQ